jgi:hypothetical protein
MVYRFHTSAFRGDGPRTDDHARIGLTASGAFTACR